MAEIKKLTVKQRKFCLEYLVDLNATQAAIRSGYSEKTACAIGTENLRKPNIAFVIQQLGKHLVLFSDKVDHSSSDGTMTPTFIFNPVGKDFESDV